MKERRIEQRSSSLSASIGDVSAQIIERLALGWVIFFAGAARGGDIEFVLEIFQLFFGKAEVETTGNDFFERNAALAGNGAEQVFDFGREFNGKRHSFSLTKQKRAHFCETKPL